VASQNDRRPTGKRGADPKTSTGTSITEQLFGATGYQLTVLQMLWNTAIKAAGQVEPPPGQNANNYNYPVIACYHRARRAIKASGPGMTDWIAGQAIHEMTQIVHKLNNPQPALFDPAKAA
jgi:hypothetical protein